MKHNLKITFVLLLMFLITQFIGLYVVNFYLNPAQTLPLGMEPPPVQTNADFSYMLGVIIFAFMFAMFIMFLLTRINAEFVLKLWFFSVVIIAMVISLTAILPLKSYILLVSLIIAVPLAYFKIYQRSIVVHNLTELFIYPGIGAVFVSILNIYTMLVLLVLISVYDMWAVWHSGIMQKMAKYQIDKLKIFGGFFVPYFSRTMRDKIKKMKKSELKKKKFKVNVAILGGGDIIFPLITAGVFLRDAGWMYSLGVVFGAAIGLSYLFFLAKKKKFYPAMPYITTGILLGLGLVWVIF